MEASEPPAQNNEEQPVNSTFRTLKELIDFVSGRNIKDTTGEGDAGFAEHLAYPFLGLVGQYEMKIALILSLINPAIKGVLLIGPRGTGKTTAIRSLLDLLPPVQRSTCFYGCLPEDIEDGGIDAVCPDCAKKYGEGIPLTKPGQASLVELPLNSSLSDVIGSLDEQSTSHIRHRIKRGLLAQADRNILYVDEVNLLEPEIINAILDAASQGTYIIRRDLISASYHARFTLIGSMNPEEGNLRPQILDRFGLRVIVKGLDDPSDRIEAYRRVSAFIKNPRQMIGQYKIETAQVSAEIQRARDILRKVEIPLDVEKRGTALIQNLKIDSLRAEITLFESARAYAAADGRYQVQEDDITNVATMCLRLRRSDFMDKYLSQMDQDDQFIKSYLDKSTPESH